MLGLSSYGCLKHLHCKRGFCGVRLDERCEARIAGVPACEYDPDNGTIYEYDVPPTGDSWGETI